MSSAPERPASPAPGADQSLPGSCRLAAADDYGRVFDKPCERIALGRVLVLARRGERARLGLVASRRILRSAVARNRFKRLVRESFRRRRARLRAVDLVVIARPGLEQWSGAQLRRALERGWQRLARP